MLTGSTGIIPKPVATYHVVDLNKMVPARAQRGPL